MNSKIFFVFRVAVLFVWLISGCSLFAQQAEDKVLQLQQLDAKQEKTTEDIVEIISLCEDLYGSNPTIVSGYLEKIKSLIQEHNYYVGWSSYCYLVKNIYIEEGATEDAVKEIRDIYLTYKHKLEEEDALYIQYCLADVLYELRELEKSKKTVDEVLAETSSESLKASLYYLRASIYRETGDYTKAIEDGIKTIELFKSINDSLNLSVAYSLVGNVYIKINNPEKALYYSQKAIPIAKKLKNDINLITFYVNAGTYHSALNQLDSALHYYQQSMVLSKKHNQSISIARNMMNIGNIYLKKEEYEKAKVHYKESLEACYQTNTKYGILLNYINLAGVYLREKNYTRTKSAIDSADVYVNILESSVERAHVQELYYELYKAQGNFKEALYHHENYLTAIQEIDKEKARKEIAELQGKYDTSLKDIEIEKIHYAFESKKAQNRTLLIGIILVVFVAGFVMFFLIYRNKTLKELYNRNIELLNTVNFYKITPENIDNRDQLKKIFDRLLNLLNNEQIFKDPNLGIKDVAELIKTNEKYISSAVATYAKMNYSNFINFYRISEAKKLINELELANLNEIMYACGFNSRTTFYNAFKKFTGLSPKQFKEMKKVHFFDHSEN